MAHKHDKYDLDDDGAPTPPGELSSNGQWIFGSIYAVLTLIGFSFGVWAGASKPKPVETAEAKKDANDKPAPKPAAPPPGTSPAAAPPADEVKPKESDTKQTEPKKASNQAGNETPAPKSGATTPGATSPGTPSPGTPPPSAPPVTSVKPKESEPKKPAVKAVAFKEVAPVLRGYCGNCHGLAGKPKGGVDLRTLASIMKGGDDGALVKPGDPDKSPLYDSIKAGRMPQDGKPGPNEKELMLIRDWIAGGAKERRRTVRRRTSRRA